MPDEIKKNYHNLELKHHAVVSQHRFDLGLTTTMEHEIHLKDKRPVDIKQFQIPDPHCEMIEKHVYEWLKIHRIVHLKREKTVELKLKSGKRTVVSVDQI